MSKILISRSRCRPFSGFLEGGQPVYKGGFEVFRRASDSDASWLSEESLVKNFFFF
jgi:hypothetical protein